MSLSALVLCPLVGAVALFWASSKVERAERKWLAWAFVLRVLGAFALVGYHQYVFRGGDMLWYAFNGEQIAKFLEQDFGAWAPEVLKLLFHADNALPVKDILEGTPTGSMAALSSILLFVTGDSLIGACLLVAFFAYLGCTCLFLAAAPELLPAERKAALIATQLLPSVVFWTSGVVKESFAISGLGFLALGISQLLRGKYRGAISAAGGAIVIALIKPYVVIAFALAVGGAALFTRKTRRFSWITSLLGVCAGIGGLIVLLRLFPEFGADKLGETLARSQFYYAGAGGGSDLEFGTAREEDIQGASLGIQLQFLPLALVNALTRPLPFDVRNFSQAAAALEMTALMWILGRTLVRSGIGNVWRAIRTSRWKAFCLAFVLVFAPPVGLATRNLGTLSRYRVPMMPMYVALVLALQAAQVKKPAPGPRALPLRRRAPIARMR